MPTRHKDIPSNTRLHISPLPDDPQPTKTIQVVRLHPAARLPQRKTEGAACFDLFTVENIVIPPAEASTSAYPVRTGLSVAIPEGYHMKIFLRSSAGLNSRLRLANQTGIIDSDYRGEVFLIIENYGFAPFNVPTGTRIAQCLIERNIPVVFEEVDELEMTMRGAGGFGSTGGAV